MHDWFAMPIKTISIELDVYERLRRLKRSDRDSFSAVLRRARFDHEPTDGTRLLAHWRTLTAEHPGVLSDGELARLTDRRRSVREHSAWDA